MRPAWSHEVTTEFCALDNELGSPCWRQGKESQFTASGLTHFRIFLECEAEAVIHDRRTSLSFLQPVCPCRRMAGDVVRGNEQVCALSFCDVALGKPSGQVRVGCSYHTQESADNQGLQFLKVPTCI